jgi:transposase InsO family protein
MEVARAVVEQQASTAQMAARLGVPYTTATEWVKRYRQGGETALHPAEPRESSKSRLPSARDAAILATHAAQPHAGTRRIRDVMRRFLGVGTSATTVRRVLHEHGELAPRTSAKAKRQRKLVRFERAEPNQLWQSDLFTFLLRRHERVYVAAFLDDHSRYLVSLAMAHHQRSTLVLEALSRGIADYGAPREILTDQGRQYTAWRGSTEFEGELRRQGIAHVKSRPHHPQTCGKIERFWKTMWEEFLSRTVFADFEDCQRRVGLFAQHYNFQRPHQALEGLTPADRFFRAAPRCARPSRRTSRTTRCAWRASNRHASPSTS